MGEILEIKKDEEIPADLMLLYAEDNEGNALDMVFIDTLNLDGENYLKQRDIIDSSITSKHALNSYSGYVKCDAPGKDLENWHGVIVKENQKNEVIGSITNLMLRGCTLRNTAKAYGLVIYVGHQTKIMLNSRAVSDKLSSLNRKMNYLLYSILIF